MHCAVFNFFLVPFVDFPGKLGISYYIWNFLKLFLFFKLFQWIGGNIGQWLSYVGIFNFFLKYFVDFVC